MTSIVALLALLGHRRRRIQSSWHRLNEKTRRKSSEGIAAPRNQLRKSKNRMILTVESYLLFTDFSFWFLWFLRSHPSDLKHRFHRHQSSASLHGSFNHNHVQETSLPLVAEENDDKGPVYDPKQDVFVSLFVRIKGPVQCVLYPHWAILQHNTVTMLTSAAIKMAYISNLMPWN